MALTVLLFVLHSLCFGVSVQADDETRPVTLPLMEASCCLSDGVNTDSVPFKEHYFKRKALLSEAWNGVIFHMTKHQKESSNPVRPLSTLPESPTGWIHPEVKQERVLDLLSFPPRPP